MINDQPETITPRVSTILQKYPRIGVGFASDTTYRQFRALAPQLVSYQDEHDGREATQLVLFAVYIDDVPVACVSCILDVNDMRKKPRTRYARVDLVIVPEKHQRLGLGRVAVLAALLHLLDTQGSHIYSVSCLAAHEAINVILQDLGFEAKRRDDHNFVHEEYRLNDENESTFTEIVASRLQEAVRLTSYRLRQRQAGTSK
jgi:RimJ/RimL family protein N-acetyltransferase